MNTAESLRRLPEDEAAKPKINLDFGKFSRMPEYIAVNQSLVESLISKLPNNFLHIDVAAGTGMVEELMKEEAEKTGRRGEVIGVDPNATSLAIARENVVSSKKVSIKFIEGKGQNLKLLLNGEISGKDVDSVSIHDALHEIWDNNDKAQIVQSMADILKPGGYFTFNTAFTTIANSEDSSGWGRWKLMSMEKLAGQRVKRNKNAEAMPVLTPEEYKEMILNTGLTVVHEKKITVCLTKEALEAIARYPGFFEGTFADMPEQEKYSGLEKSDALVSSLYELGLPALNKVWYEIIAQKPAAAPVTVFGI